MDKDGKGRKRILAKPISDSVILHCNPKETTAGFAKKTCGRGQKDLRSLRKTSALVEQNVCNRGESRNDTVFLA